MSRNRMMPVLMAVVVLAIAVPFLGWHQTWFGRRLSEEQLGKYLQDNERPRRIQHALSQIADRIVQEDPRAGAWYPEVVALATHPVAKIRITAAWVMGQDNRSEAFRRALLGLLADEDVMVRRNAALSLVRFQDPSGRPELVAMLRPYGIRSPARGELNPQMAAGKEIGAGTLLARIRTGDDGEVEVRSPFAGSVHEVLAPQGARVELGDEVLSVAPGADQVWEALRALHLVGQFEDLAEIEPYLGERPGMPDRIQRQAALAAEAIRTRSERSSIR